MPFRQTPFPLNPGEESVEKDKNKDSCSRQHNNPRLRGEWATGLKVAWNHARLESILAKPCVRGGSRQDWWRSLCTKQRWADRVRDRAGNRHRGPQEVKG